VLWKNQVEFLVVGAYALAAHAFPRATGDIDIDIDISWNPPPSATGRTKDRADVEEPQKLTDT
jgi:hypothetical protein